MLLTLCSFYFFIIVVLNILKTPAAGHRRTPYNLQTLQAITGSLNRSPSRPESFLFWSHQKQNEAPAFFLDGDGFHNSREYFAMISRKYVRAIGWTSVPMERFGDIFEANSATWRPLGGNLHPDPPESSKHQKVAPHFDVILEAFWRPEGNQKSHWFSNVF